MSNQKVQTADVVYDTVVIGGGMAGLTAARTIAEAGCRVLLLEARDRLGGRIHTVRDGDSVIELGAEFVHGRPSDLLALLAEAELELVERDGSMVYADGDVLHVGHGEEGGRSEGDHAEPMDRLRNLAAPNAGPSSDQSFASWIEAQRDLDEATRESTTGYVEGFNAADAREISTQALGVQQAAEDATEGNRVFHVAGGYDRLVLRQAARARAAGVTIRLNAHVGAVHWQPGRVDLTLDDETFIARQAVITVPLSLLQSGEPRIRPMPEAILAAADLMRMGAVCRFTLLFCKAFWRTLPHSPELRDLSFLLAFGSMPPVWWTTLPESTPTLTGWVGGPRAEAMLGRTPAELAVSACETLAGWMHLPGDMVRRQLRALHIHDWQGDPFSRGAYSYVAVGGLDASRQMSEPVANTLFFAGEHTDTTGHWGTVHGAMRSGVRVAAQVLRTRESAR